MYLYQNFAPFYHFLNESKIFFQLYVGYLKSAPQYGPQFTDIKLFRFQASKSFERQKKSSFLGQTQEYAMAHTRSTMQ